MTNGPVSGGEEAYEKVACYIQRWKIERFHFVLKSGRDGEKLQERSRENRGSGTDVFNYCRVHNEPDIHTTAVMIPSPIPIEESPPFVPCILAAPPSAFHA